MFTLVFFFYKNGPFYLCACSCGLYHKYHRRLCVHFTRCIETLSYFIGKRPPTCVTFSCEEISDNFECNFSHIFYKYRASHLCEFSCGLLNNCFEHNFFHRLYRYRASLLCELACEPSSEYF